MVALARKVAISATDEGVILRSAGLKELARDVRVEYGSHRITASPSRSSAPVDGRADEKQPPEPEEVECHGIVGLLDLVSSAHLIVITQRQQVAQIHSKAICTIRDVTLVSLASKAEAEKGIAAARKSVGRQAPEADSADSGAEVADAGAETGGEESEVEITEDEGDGGVRDDGREDDAKPAEAEALEAPKQGLLNRGTGVARGVITSPMKVGRFAGKWFARGGRKSKDLDEDPRDDMTDDVAGGDAAAHATEIERNGTPNEEEKLEESKADSAPVGTEKEQEKKDHGQSVIESLTPRILRGARLYFSSSGFFFSYEHDLSGALTQKSEGTGASTLWKGFDPVFFWNRHLLSPFINAGLDDLVLPLLQGFVGQRAFSIETTEPGENDVVADAAQDPDEVVAAQATPAPNLQVTEDKKQTREFLLTLISRRSTRRAGLRYRRRGIDDEGSVANFVETEQILSTQSCDLSDKAFSLLQIRGSIPLFFNQSPYSFKPQPITFGSEATNHAAFVKHFEWLNKRYGEVQIASLVDKSATEVGIGELYGKHVQMANNGNGILGSQIGFEWFDFHHQCKGMRFENVSILLETLESKLQRFGWIEKQNDRNSRLQKGVLRTNCMDCLDRSNVVQSAIAGWALEKQLEEAGLQIDLKKDPGTQWFNTLWADNGDFISKQYAGTAALKGDFTRTRKRNWTGALSDFSLTLTRYYNNIFADYFLQACIDYYLGNVGPSVFEEFEADMMSQDYALDMRRVRQNGIETCMKIVLEDPKETFQAGWTLSCPKEANTLRTLPFEECVLLLTNNGLYFCRFDWDTEKVGSFERVDLRDVVGIWRGPYITSALGPTHLDEERNVGLAIRYKTSDRAIVRRNTRSLRNEEEAEDENAGKDNLEKQQQPEKDETRMLAFKALPPQASAAKGEVEDTAALSEGELVKHICAEMRKAMAALRVREGESQDVLPEVEEKYVISAADARKATGYMESIGYSLKRLKRLPADAKRSYSGNQAKSTFLSIAPEIRNRIYRYVLGNRTVQLEGFRTVTCRSATNDRGAAESAIGTGRELGFTTWQDNHINCFASSDGNDSRTGLSLSLLEVCRQIHSEASLIPFTANTFCFEWGTCIAAAVRKLLSEQRRAIKSISILGRSSFLFRPPLTNTKVLDKLAGLRHITILVNLTIQWESRDALRLVVAARLNTTTPLLKWVGWEAAVVCVASREKNNHQGIPVLIADDFRAESRDMERIVLDWNGPVELKRNRDARKRKHDEVKRKREDRDRKAQAVHDARVQAEQTTRLQRNAARSQRGLRKGKVESYGA